jgi:lipoprotein-releasing system ATP-binding protein
MNKPVNQNSDSGRPRAFLQAENVEKAYGRGKQRLLVLRGLSMHVDKGELLLVVGSSGAGKSTLLHILGLIDTPTAGAVYLEGQNLFKLSARRQAIHRNRLFGFVFQFFHLLPDFTALENVMMPAYVGGRGAVENPRERALELLKRMGLEERATHRPGELSGGERQRVAIARALMNKPQVLFMDEPTGNLDSGTAAQIHDLIWDLNQTLGQTIVIVTHDETLARRKARILRIRDGRIVN